MEISRFAGGCYDTSSFKVGDQVRLFDGKSVGTIDSIEKRKAVVNYGVFTTQVNLEALDLVQAAKKAK